MGHTITLAPVGAAAFKVLAGVRLGLLMKKLLPRPARAGVRLGHGGNAPGWPSVLVVYSTLWQRPFVLTLVDVPSGVLASAAGAVAVRIVVR